LFLFCLLPVAFLFLDVWHWFMDQLNQHHIDSNKSSWRVDQKDQQSIRYNWIHFGIIPQLVARKTSPRNNTLGIWINSHVLIHETNIITTRVSFWLLSTANQWHWKGHNWINIQCLQQSTCLLNSRYCAGVIDTWSSWMHHDNCSSQLHLDNWCSQIHLGNSWVLAIGRLEYRELCFFAENLCLIALTQLQLHSHSYAREKDAKIEAYVLERDAKTKAIWSHKQARRHSQNSISAKHSGTH
jgi:hypothetical protein